MDRNTLKNDKSRVKIKYWWNRSGDNIYQLKNAIHIAVYLKLRYVIFPEHVLFNTTVIDVCPSNFKEGIINGIFSNWQSPKKCGQLDVDALIKAHNSNEKEVIRIMQNIINVKPKDFITDNDVCLYIRSGDCFGKNRDDKFGKHTLQTSVSTGDWIPYPLDFYVKMIEARKWENVYLICEDTLHPVVNVLLDKYPDIHFKIQSLQEDISYIISARNINICRNSMFVSMLLYFNKDIKTVYSLDDAFDNVLSKEYRSIVYHSNGFFEKIGDWQMTKKQIDIITNHTINCKPDNC